jgi:hypothetical protein
VNGTAGTEKTITSKNSGQNEITLIPEKKNVLNNPLVNPEKFLTSTTYQTWTDEKFHQGNG